MDQIDRKILALYQHDTRRVAESIGAEVGLSAAAVQRRLKRLRASGVIRSEIAVIDHHAAGVPITCIVAVAMAASPAPGVHLDRFRRDVQRDASVQQCYHVTGASDFVLVVTSSSMEAYGRFCRDWFESNPKVARFDTQVVLDRVKTGLCVPLSPSTVTVIPVGSRMAGKRKLNTG